MPRVFLFCIGAPRSVPSPTSDVGNIWYRDLAQQRNPENEAVEVAWLEKQKAAIREENEPLIGPSPQQDVLEGNVLPQENKEEGETGGSSEGNDEDWKIQQQKLNANRKMHSGEYSMLRNLPPVQPNEVIRIFHRNLLRENNTYKKFR